MISLWIPITGNLRFPILVFEWVFAICSLEIALVFVVKYFQKVKELRSSQELGIFALFTSLAFMRFCYIITDFYISIEPLHIIDFINERTIILNFGYLANLLGFFFFSLLVERYEKFIFNKSFFTYSFLTSISLFWIFYFLDLRINQFIFMAGWFVFLIFSVIYFNNFFKRVKNKQKAFLSTLEFISLFLIMTIGQLFSNHDIIEILGLEFRFLGSILQLISITMFLYSFIRLPSFIELDWKNKIEELILLEKSGLCIYFESFIDKTIDQSAVFMCGAMQSVNIMLEELTSTKFTQTSIIEKKGKIVNTYSGKFLTGIFISSEKLDSINFYLKKLVEMLENIFQDILVDWDGIIEAFSPIKHIVKDFLK